MRNMSISERYDEIAKLSGLSEKIIRSVFNATKQSLEESLKRGERATLPGIVTFKPEIRIKTDYENGGIKNYIKVKAAASSVISGELEKQSAFIEPTKSDLDDSAEKLNFTDISISIDDSEDHVRTHQISALI